MTDQPQVPPTTPEQRRASFRKIATAVPDGATAACRGCGQPMRAHLNLLCEDCFVVGTPTARGTGPACAFCGRHQEQVDATKETLIAGRASGVAICTTCACGVAGCMGAKSAGEARAMMAHSSLQAEAVQQCLAVMRAVGNIKPESMAADPATVHTLVQAAECLARIARGDA